MFTSLLGSMTQLLLMILLGFFLEKRRFLGGQETKDSLTKLLIDVLTPLNILSASANAFSPEAGRSVLICLGLSVGFYVFFLAFCFLVFRAVPIEESKRGVAITSCVFANTGFMGYPLVTSLFGSEGLLYASSFGIGYNLFMFTVGVRFLNRHSGKFSLKSIITTNFVAVVLTNIIYFTGLRLPEFLVSFIKTMGSVTVPVSMLVIGTMFVGIKPKEIFQDGYAYLVAFIRLLLIPLLLCLFLKLTGILPVFAARICVLIAAMPVGSFNVILSKHYGGDADFANRCLTISMVFSLATIPLIVSIMG